jgi:hypothetical protein
VHKMVTSPGLEHDAGAHAVDYHDGVKRTNLGTPTRQLPQMPRNTGESKGEKLVERKNQPRDEMAREEVSPILTRASNVRWRKIEPPKPKSRATIRLAEGTCRHCGFVANHETPVDCITFLRDVISQLAGSDALESALARVKAKADTEMKMTVGPRP